MKDNKPTMETTCNLYMHAEILRQLWLSSNRMAAEGKSALDVSDAIRVAANQANEAYKSALAQFNA